MATIQSLPDVFVSLESGVPQEVGDELATEASKAGFSVAMERRESEVFASAIEWLVPTAIILFVGRKFIDTLAAEAAKDAYPAVKAAVLRILARTCGKGRKIEPRFIASAPGKISPGPKPALTVLIEPVHGIEVRFVFPPHLDPDLHVKALESLVRFARELETLPPPHRKPGEWRAPPLHLRLRFRGLAAS